MLYKYIIIFYMVEQRQYLYFLCSEDAANCVSKRAVLLVVEVVLGMLDESQIWSVACKIASETSTEHNTTSIVKVSRNLSKIAAENKHNRTAIRKPVHRFSFNEYEYMEV